MLLIHLKQIAGTSWTPDATCAAAVAGNTFNGASDNCGGTAGTDVRHVMQIWNATDFVGTPPNQTMSNASNAAVAACGNKLGFRNEMAKAYGKIDLSGGFTAAGITDGAHSYTGSLVDGWKDTSATAQWDGHSCVPTTIDNTTLATHLGVANPIPAFACKSCADNGVGGGTANDQICDATGETTVVWQVNANVSGNGCVLTGTSTPVQNQNWSGGVHSGTTIDSKFNDSTTTYTNHDHDNDATTAAVNLTCRWVGGTFNDDGTTAGAYDGDGTDTAFSGGQTAPKYAYASGASCSSVTDPLEQLKCYASASDNGPGDTTVCAKKVFFDWSATSAGSFVKVAEPGMAQNEFAFGMVEASATGDIVVETVEETRYEQIQSGTSWENCEVSSRTRLVFKPVSATRYLVEFTDVYTLRDQKPACLAEDFDTTPGLFYFDKQ